MLQRRRFRRDPRRRFLRYALFAIVALVALDVLSILKDYREFAHNLSSHTYTDASTLPTPVRNQKIFIVATFWTNAYVIYYRWAEALMNLVHTLGPDNVFVSIYESGSLDNTKEMLTWLDEALLEHHFPKLRRDIKMDNVTHEDEINAGPFNEQGNPRPGWILPPDSQQGKEIRRIPFLAKTRNLSLLPLLREKAAGRTYDKILFLNDVVFKPSDVLTLLATNQGSYSAACALDHHLPANFGTYYDTFVLRDNNGQNTLSPQFPYFRPSESLKSMLRGTASKVSSCWNGMLLMDAAPFYGPRPDMLPAPMDDTELGLPFRGIPDSLASKHLEGSECCLIHTDLATVNPSHAGVYINPSVRVGYTIEAYNATHFGPNQDTFLSGTQYVFAKWLHRLNRLRTPSMQKQLESVRNRVQKWLKDEGTLAKRELELGKGEMCLIDEMHLLIWNGWRHAW
jgi:hypothetical protein